MVMSLHWGLEVYTCFVLQWALLYYWRLGCTLSEECHKPGVCTYGFLRLAP